MAGSPDPKAGRIVDRHLTLFVPRGEGYQGHSPWLVSYFPAQKAVLDDRATDLGARTRRQIAVGKV
jgi:hypothetical protein